MSSSSLFTRLTRYAYNAKRQPYEERLTEAFAATLAASPDATDALLHALLTDPPNVAKASDLSVATQRQTSLGDRVDIEVRIGPASRPNHVIWIELKWSAPADAEQLRRYARAQRSMPWTTDLLFIAPDAPDFAPDVPAATATWQQVASTYSDWSPPTKQTRPLDHGTAMVTAFIGYLAENSLAMTDAFTLTDALALQNASRAKERYRAVRDRALAELSDGPRAPLRRGEEPHFKQSDPTDFYCHYSFIDDPLNDKPTRWLEFHGRPDDSRARPQGERILGAGLTFQTVDDFGPADAEWLRDMGRHGFERGVNVGDGKHSYLFRYKTLAELTAGADIDEQGTLLARWVIETFQLVRAKTLE